MDTASILEVIKKLVSTMDRAAFLNLCGMLYDVAALFVKK